MTMPATVEPFGTRMPTADERSAADQLRQILAARSGEDREIELDIVHEGKPASIALSPMMSDLLMGLLRQLSMGNAVTLVPISQQLTTQQAADILNISRPSLIKLIDNGALTCELVGRHRRLMAEDVFAYKAEMKARRAKALQDLADVDGELI